MMYVTKIVPLDAVMYAFGRIYSGTVRAGTLSDSPTLAHTNRHPHYGHP